MIIPAPDVYRCQSQHPEYGFQCMKAAGHEAESRHQFEKPDDLRGDKATTVYCWGTAPPSEFPEGSFTDVPAIHRASDYRDP